MSRYEVPLVATVAIQTLYAVRSSKEEERPEKPSILNTCMAYATDSPVVKRRWPHLYTGAKETAPAASAESPEQAILRDLEQQAAILNAPDSKPEQREQAAERMVQRRRDDATEILLAAIGDSGNRAAQVAVARALAHARQPVVPPSKYLSPSSAG